MEFRIDEGRLGHLFPAFIAVTAWGRIETFGPSLSRQFPGLRTGANLAEHFVWDAADSEARLAMLTASGAPVELASLNGTCRLSGSVLPWGEKYLLALRLVPSQFALGSGNFLMSDFGPDDPIVAGLMLVGLQKAMLDESRENALDLARERKRSMELLDRISRVSGYMAHDFNNLLSIIRLNADRIANTEESNARNNRLAGIIIETAERGSEITRSLMTLSRQRNESRTCIALDDVIQENRAFFKTIVGTRINLELQLAAPGRMVEANRNSTVNALINLLVNARDAMPQGGTVTLSTGIRRVALCLPDRPETREPGDYLAVVISDTGGGMNAETMARAFEPLFSTKTDGNGIGLASVQDFAHELGGEVCLDSAPGKGAAIYLYLPATETAHQALPAQRARTGSEAPEIRHKVLLVEDEPYALEALTEVLEAQGLDVTPCLSAAEARHALSQGPYSLLVTDILLAEENGIDLAHQACSLAPGLCVILMSGYSPEHAEVHPDWLYIRKPLGADRLREVVGTALNMRKPEGPFS